MKRIRWTETAARNLTRICDYTEEHYNPEAARGVALAIWEAINTLREFPLRGRPGKKMGTRELILTELPYLVIYRVGGETVEITRIVHGAQRWPE